MSGWFRRRESYRRDETVSDARKRLDIYGTFSRIAQRGSQAIDSGVQSALEIHESIGRPKLGAQFVATDYLARLFEQGLQNVKWPSLQTYARAVLTQLAGIEKNFEGAKSNREGVDPRRTDLMYRAVGIDRGSIHTLANRLSG